MRSNIAPAAVLSFLVASAASASLVVTEIMQNPRAVSDSNGEWFEVYNSGAEELNLNGWTFSDNDNDSFTIEEDVIVGAGEYFVLGVNSDILANGGVEVGYDYPGNWYLANGGDEVVITDDLGAEIDRVEYDGGPVFPDPNGASMFLVNPMADNSDGSRWAEAGIETYGDGDFGTPTLHNEEIMFIAVENGPAEVLKGDTLAFDVTLENPTDLSVGTDAWVHVTDGADIDVTPIVKIGLNLPQGFQITTNLRLFVPLMVASGDYTVTANLGTLADDVVRWSDSFVVTVSDPM